MAELSSKTGYEILNVSDGEIIPVSELEYEDNQKLVICDDYVCDKNQKKLIDYSMQGRRKNCSVIYLSQSFFKTPFEIRKGCTHYCLYQPLSKGDTTRISSELGINKEDFKSATRKPNSFLYFDKPKKYIAKNFTGNLN